VPQTSVFEVELAIENLRSLRLTDIQIPAEMIQEGVEELPTRSIKLLFIVGIRRNCLRSERSTSLYLFVKRTINQIVVIRGAYHICQLYTKFYPTSCSQG
jgi:hypothetical protein